jgi:hypothetical protein
MRRPARWAATSLARNNPRNRHERTFTGRIKSGRTVRTHRVPSMEIPPPGTIMWTWGMRQRRAPGVKHRGDADAGAEVFGIGRDGSHGLGRGRAGAVSFGQSKTRRREPAGSEFGRRLRIEPEKTVELFGMKQPTISIDNMDLPSGLKQSASLRHSEYGAGEERSDALSVF